MSSLAADKVRRPRVCFATSMGGYNHARMLDGVLGQALDLRGADVEFLLCDKALPVCQQIKIGGRAMPEQLQEGAPIAYCDKCVARGRGALGDLGYPVQVMSDYLTPEEVARAEEIATSVPEGDIPTFRFEGLPVGEHAHAGALRYFAKGELKSEPLGTVVLRRYLKAGMLTIFAVRRLLATRKYDILVANHGIYIPQGMICEVARSMGVRVVTYNPAYRKHSFIFSHNESYHFTMLDEPIEHWTALDLTPEIDRDIHGYLASRRTGANDWIWFHDQPKEDVGPILREIGADPDKPYIALLTSVVWDAQLHYKANAFPNMLDWLRQTVAYWGTRADDLQLVIRVHPAEVRGGVPSRQRVVEELAASFPTLPRNVFIFPPEHQASTYALCDSANAVVIFNTKTGVEVAATGVPVIVAGEAWVRGKGFARDVASPADYFRLMDSLPLKADQGMNPAQRVLADKYAYHFFFRRMIPLPFIHQEPTGDFRVELSSRADLAPGRYPGLDVISEGILHGTPFIYRAETLDDPFPGERALASVTA